MRSLVLLAVLGAGVPSSVLEATTPLTKLRYAPDTTAVLSGTTVSPANVADDDLSGTVTVVPIGPIPAGARLDGYALKSNGDQLLSFDTAVILGGATFLRNDIIRYDGSAYTLQFSGSANGAPDGTDLRDFAGDGSGNLIMSFDTTVALSGGALTVTPQDIVKWNGSAFSSFFGGSAAGVPPGVAIDGIHLLPSGNILISFDGSGSVGGVAFNDEDILEYTPGTPGTWELAYNGAAAQPAGWPSADLGALDANPSAVPVTLMRLTAE